MQCVDFKYQLPENAEDGAQFKVGFGAVWTVYRFNVAQDRWIALYWAT